MRLKYASILIIIVFLLNSLVACDTLDYLGFTDDDGSSETSACDSGDSFTSDNKIIETIESDFVMNDDKFTENSEYEEDSLGSYPDIEEAETDLSEADYSKFVFYTDAVQINSDEELNISNYNDARKMLKTAEEISSEGQISEDYNNALILLHQIIENSGEEYVIMASVHFTGNFGGYYVSTGYREMYNMYLNSGERQDLLFFSQKNINAERFLKAWERFTKYSYIYKICFYTVPIVTTQSVNYSKVIFKGEEFITRYGDIYKRVTDEDEFNEVIDYYFEFTNSADVTIECSSLDLDIDSLDISYSQIIRNNEYNTIYLMIQKEDFNLEAIKSLTRNNAVINIYFKLPVAVDE